MDKARIATPSIEKQTKTTHPFPACPTLLSVAFACPALGPGNVSVNAYAKASVEAILWDQTLICWNRALSLVCWYSEDSVVLKPMLV